MVKETVAVGGVEAVGDSRVEGMQLLHPEETDVVLWVVYNWQLG